MELAACHHSGDHNFSDGSHIFGKFLDPQCRWHFTVIFLRPNTAGESLAYDQILSWPCRASKMTALSSVETQQHSDNIWRPESAFATILSQGHPADTDVRNYSPSSLPRHSRFRFMFVASRNHLSRSMTQWLFDDRIWRMGLQLVGVKDTRQSTEYRGSCINRRIPPLMCIVSLSLHRPRYTFTANISQIWHNWCIYRPFHLSAQHLLWLNITPLTKKLLAYH
jgi:hypothetical protein